jgi:hypothetical protein
VRVTELHTVQKMVLLLVLLQLLVLIVHGMELDYWMYITGRGSGCTSAVAGGVMNCSTAN